MTSVIYAWLRSYAQLQSKDATPVICLTLVGGRDSGRKIWLWSYIPTPINVTTPVAHYGSGRGASRMSYQLICKRLRMVQLDNCNILWLEHLGGSNLSRVYDLFSVWNLSISQLHMFKCQAMCRVTNEHLAQLDLRETRVSRRTRYPLQPRQIKDFECLVRRA
jgi:hypothetical protein